MAPGNPEEQFIGKELGALSQGVLFQGVNTAASVGCSINLSAVGVVQGDNTLMFVSNPRWYPFSRVLIVKSPSGEINDIPTSDVKAISEITKGLVAKKVTYFSGFLGMIDFEGKMYLIFAKEVSIHMFYEYDPVLQTSNIQAVDLTDGSVHEALSSQLTELVGQNGYFTFKTNITQRLTASTHKQKYNHQMFWAGACFFEQVKKFQVSKDWDLHFTLGSFEQIALKHKGSDLKITMAARKSVLDSNKLPFIFDSTNYVIHEVIVEYEDQKWMLCYTTSNPSLFRLQDIDLSVSIPRGAEKVCEEVKSHIRYTNNTHSGTNWWFVISDKKEDTQELMSEVIQVAINSNSGDMREVYDVSLQDLKKEVDVRPISFSGAVHSIYEILGTSNVVDIKKYPHALNNSKDVLDNHLHYLLLQKTQVGCSQVHLMMLFALLLRGLGIADLADQESFASVQQMIFRMQKRLNGHVEEVMEGKSEETANETTEDAQIQGKPPAKIALEEVLQSTSLNRATPTTADALREARSDGGCFEESTLNVLVFTWDVRSYKPEDPILLKEFLHQFDKTQLPGVITVCLQSVIESSGLKGALGVFKGEDKHLSRWSTLFTTLMQMVDSSFVLDSQEMMIGLITLNFVHASISKQVSKSQIHEIKSGMKGLLGTKGSLVTSFCFKDKLINLCNTHLHGGSDYEKREKKLADIIDTYAHAKRGPDALVLSGNFNFKLFSKTPLKTHIAGKVPGESGTMWADWQAYDEVSCGMHPNLKLRFKEAPITFAATVGIDPKAPKLVYAEDSVPAWSDRVFVWTSKRHQVEVDIKNYTSLPIKGSTHLPVVALVSFKYKEFINHVAEQKYSPKVIEDVSVITPDQVLHAFNTVISPDFQAALANTLTGSPPAKES